MMMQTVTRTNSIAVTLILSADDPRLDIEAMAGSSKAAREAMRAAIIDNIPNISAVLCVMRPVDACVMLQAQVARALPGSGQSNQALGGARAGMRRAKPRPRR